MTYLINLDDFRSLLEQPLLFFLDGTFGLSIVLVFLVIFFKKTRVCSLVLFRLSAALSAVFFLVGNLIASYIRFSYLKMVVSDLEGGRQISNILMFNYNNLAAEIHLYIGYFMALYLLVVSFVFWLVGKGTKRQPTVLDVPTGEL